MSQQQVRRNAGHRGRQAGLLAAADSDAKRLNAAFDWFRSSVRLAARRNSRHVPIDVRADVAARLMRDMTVYLTRAAEAIDRGDHDPERGNSQ